MTPEEMIQKIMEKREFSKLPINDVKLAFRNFENKKVSDEEKIRLTRELLHKVFGAFSSQKLLGLKDKDSEWILRKHLSTRERLPYYEEVYKRILGKTKTGTILDLGSGINGFSYNYFGRKFNYIAIEGVGQLVDLMNYYFKKNNFKARAVHLSLFEIEKVESLIKNEKGEKIIFLFKVLDSLESMEKDYSKKFLKEIVPLVDRVIVSFATRSMISRKRFNVNRKWIFDFIKNNFKMLDDFE